MASQNERRSIFQINEMVARDPALLVQRSEELYESQICRTAEAIGREGCSILLLSGPSASTKTTTARKLSEQLARQGIFGAVISLDDFFINRDMLPLLPNGEKDFESIRILDLETLNQCFAQLLRWREADFPIFDFVEGRRSERVQRIRLQKDSLLIVEGIHALNPAVAGSQNPADFRRIYISPNSDYYQNEERILKARQIRLIRRIVRDYFHRGNTVENTLRMWENVVASERVNILPFKAEADYIIDSTILYEPCLYRYWLDWILDQSSVGEKYLPQVEELVGALSRFAALPLGLVPENTVLHEFLQ